MGAIRWLGRNLSTLLLAFVLALIVWGSAITAADPNQERNYQIPIQIIGQDSDVEILSGSLEQLSLTLYGPNSILDQIDQDPNALQAWVDLSGLKQGTHTLPVLYAIPDDIRPYRLLRVEPSTVEITLERLVSQAFPIQTEVKGQPALGYQQGEITWSDLEVSVYGHLSKVQEVASVEASVNIDGANEDIEKTISLIPRDAKGNLVSGVSLSPDKVTIRQSITLRGGYRNMVVKVVTSGQVAEGYRQTNITVSPPNVMVFSADPAMINQLPGYIETHVLDLTGTVDDIETVLALNLPEGVSVIGDPNVLVQVGVAAIEGSININRRVEIIGIIPGLAASVAPDNVEVIIYGPIPTLQTLTDVDVRVVVDLTGLEEGVYPIEPDVIILPDQIRLQVISPETLEVEITKAEQATPALTPTTAP